ncbi:MAG: EAL domain-containing protein [Sporichthyaceae bacterium]|nr:EAL domain-containing protein [Sporichthyaceae bacterium]
MAFTTGFLRRYRPPTGGLDRVRWFFLCFAVFTCVTAPMQVPSSSPVPPAFWVAGVPAIGYLLWRRLCEYRAGALQPPAWDVAEGVAVFVALLIIGPLGGGLGVFYAGVYFRVVFGSTRRVLTGALVYLLALFLSSWWANQLSPIPGSPWQQQLGQNVIGIAFSTLLMWLMLRTLVAHQRALTQERQLLTAVLDNVESAVIAAGSDGTPLVRNRAALNLYAELALPEPPAPWHDAVTLYRGDAMTPLRPEDLPMEQVLNGQRLRDAELGVGLADGTYRSFLVNGQPLSTSTTDGVGAVLTITDVTARKKAEERLAHLALHDPLTGLTNRVLLRDRLEHALQRRSADEERVRLLFIDLDGFKTVNDSLGHPVGDQVLVVVANRIRSILRTQDTVARLGGDEFAVLIEDEPEEVAIATAERILAALRERLEVDERSVVVTASIGIASGGAATTADELLRNADLAMYAAKERGNRFERFQPAMHAFAVQRLVLQADLQTALDRNEFFLQYQPVMSLTSGRVTGVEALLRWRHPHRGVIPPLEFIPLAESSGLILSIGTWVVHEACRQLCEWRRKHPAAAEGLTAAVNVAVSQLEAPNLVDEVAGALAENGLKAEDLVLEITESAMSEHLEVGPTLRELRRIGVVLALDDFGTGYSSMSRLRLFPVQKVKIDRSFVKEIGHSGDSDVLVVTTLALAHGLGMEAVAEGVETQAQLEFLRDNGCAEAQGYLFSRPVDAHSIESILAAQDVAPLAEPAALTYG